MFDDIRERLAGEASVTFDVRVRPNAPKTQTRSVMSDGSIKIDLAAPPENGQANEELIRFLAEELDVPLSHVEILAGATARIKKVRAMH